MHGVALEENLILDSIAIHDEVASISSLGYAPCLPTDSGKTQVVPVLLRLLKGV